MKGATSFISIRNRHHNVTISEKTITFLLTVMYYSSPSYYQTGSGLPAFRGGVMQNGYGLGGIFKGIMRSIAPKLKQGLNASLENWFRKSGRCSCWGRFKVFIKKESSTKPW